MRLKKYLKDMTLVLLIFISLILVFQVWFSSNIVPNEAKNISETFQESILEPVLSFFKLNKNSTSSQDISSVFWPQKIVLNDSNKRSVLYYNSEEYQHFYQMSEDFIKNIMLGNIKIKSKDTVTLDEYFSVLKGNSIYLDYDNLYDFRLFSVSICGEADNEWSSDYSSVRECMISLGDNVLNNVSVYMRDYKSGTVFRYILEENKEALEKELDRYFLSHQSASTLSYSFELNFHKQESGDGSLSKLVFDPLILFNLVATEGKSIHSDQNWFQDWLEIESSRAGSILNTFQINPMTMLKYTDMNNARVFVENDGTLTISPNGLLEYHALESGQGLRIYETEDKSAFDIYAAASAAANFVYAVNEDLPKSAFTSIRFSTDLIENNSQGSYTIEFDLCAGGIPVMQTDPVTGERCHSITMRIENGYLKQYRQFVRLYSESDSTEPVTPVINAMDGLIDTLNPQTEYLSVFNVSRCYVDDGAAELLAPQWKVGVEGIQTILTVK